MLWFWRTLRAARFFPWRPAAAVPVLWSVGVLSWWAPGFQSWVFRAAAGVLVGCVVWWVGHRLVVPVTTGTWVVRRDEASEHAGGVASRLDVAEVASAAAVRRKARTLRPSMRGLSWWGLRRVPVTEFAVEVVRSGWFAPTRSVWSSCQDVTLRIGGPRMGKSGSLGCHVLDAPGALVVTSSREDLLDATRAHRRRRGRVEVFNPTGLGGLPSSVRWSPLAGCADLATAQRRAEDLVPSGASSEAERWDAQARGFLTVLMHAAALSGGSMRTVLDWVSPADDTARDEVLAALRSGPGRPARAVISEVRSTFATNDRTLTSITATMLPALRWLVDATAATVGDADPSDPAFLDVAGLVSGGSDSLYLVGREGSCRPLIGALTAEVAHQARMAAARRPGGRLDPPLTVVLDEAPLTCGPVPLEDWTADMGGRGVTLHVGAQSLAQVREVWGTQRAGAILGNTATLVVFGGLKATEDLEAVSTLTGTRLVQVDEDDRRHVPVMSPAQISALPELECLVMRNGLRPVVGRAPMYWDRAPGRLDRAWTAARHALGRAATRVLAARGRPATPGPATAPPVPAARPAPGDPPTTTPARPAPVAPVLVGARPPTPRPPTPGTGTTTDEEHQS